MPEEKTIIGVPEEIEKKLKENESKYKEMRDVLDVPGRQSEIWIDGKDEKQAENSDVRFVSSYERKLREIELTVPLSTTPQTTTDDANDNTRDDTVKYDADSIRHMENAEGRVQKLLDLALLKGVTHAVSVAKEIDVYTLDRTHDRLADEFSDELRKRGLLKDDVE